MPYLCLPHQTHHFRHSTNSFLVEYWLHSKPRPLIHCLSVACVSRMGGSRVLWKRAVEEHLCCIQTFPDSIPDIAKLPAWNPGDPFPVAVGNTGLTQCDNFLLFACLIFIGSFQAGTVSYPIAQQMSITWATAASEKGPPSPVCGQTYDNRLRLHKDFERLYFF